MSHPVQQLLNTYFGTTLHSVEDVIRGGRLDWSTTAMFAGQILVGLALMVVVGFSARKQFQKHADRAIELRRLNDGAHRRSLIEAGTLRCLGRIKPSGRAAANADACAP